MPIHRGNLPFLPYRTKHKTYARENRKSPTYAENIVREAILRKKQTGRKFTRQKPIGSFIVDFRCSKLMLVIEIDGSSHRGREGYDNRRTKELQTLGIRVVRFTNQDVIYHIDWLFIEIYSILDDRVTFLSQPKNTLQA